MPTLFVYFVIIASIAVLPLLDGFSNEYRLLYTTFGILSIIKIASLPLQSFRFSSFMGGMIYFSIWPGVSTAGFCRRQPISFDSIESLYLQVILPLQLLAFGVVAFFCIGTYAAELDILLGFTLRNYLAFAAMIFILPFGILPLLHSGLLVLGFRPRPIFREPYFAVSMREFWSERWNLAYVDMNRIVFLEPLQPYLNGLQRVGLTFFLSALFHEVAFSFPVRANYGLPSLYFFLQMLFFIWLNKRTLPSWLVVLIIVLPSPLLFHPVWINTYIGSLVGFVFVSP